MTIKRRDGKSQTPFSEWIRNNPCLDSSNGFSCMDIDWIWHQYLVSGDTIGTRTVNHIMLIEEKTCLADISHAERDSMLILKQALEIADRCGRKFLTARKDKLRVRFWGYFKLRHDGKPFSQHSIIYWNKRKINLDQLEKILQFKLNPRTLISHSDRRHHGPKNLPLFSNESHNAQI